MDCVGACVGMKGMRVQSIIRELRGEKIDIIEFSDDPVVFATHALSPAKISRVAIIDSAEKHMEVIVEDYAALAGDRQEGSERAAGGEAAGLADRHQDGRREAAGSGSAHGRPLGRDTAFGAAGASSAGTCIGTPAGGWHRHGGKAGFDDSGGAGADCWN
ncbi:MAG: hypothetical protein QM757_24695 [Paludibaculum sp.]